MSTAAHAPAALTAIRFDGSTGEEMQPAQAGGGEPSPLHQLAYAALTDAEHLGSGAHG